MANENKGPKFLPAWAGASIDVMRNGQTISLNMVKLGRGEGAYVGLPKGTVDGAWIDQLKLFGITTTTVPAPLKDVDGKQAVDEDGEALFSTTETVEVQHDNSWDFFAWIEQVFNQQICQACWRASVDGKLVDQELTPSLKSSLLKSFEGELLKVFSTENTRTGRRTSEVVWKEFIELKKSVLAHKSKDDVAFEAGRLQLKNVKLEYDTLKEAEEASRAAQELAQLGDLNLA